MGNKSKGVTLSEAHYQNLRFLQCDVITVSIIMLAYIAELIKGSRTPLYIAVFFVILLTPVIMGITAYKKNREASSVRYLLGIGYCVMYTFVLLTAVTPMTFVYILPIMIGALVYQRSELIAKMGIFTVLANIAYVVITVIRTEVQKTDIVNFEIQILVVILIGVFGYVISKALENISNAKLSEIELEKDKTEALLEKIMSTTDTLCGNISEINSEAGDMASEGGNARVAISEIMEGTNELAITIQNQLEMSENITEMTNATTKIAESVQEQVNGASVLAESGSKDVKSLQDAAVVCKNAGAEVDLSMKKLDQKTIEALEILNMIESVTEQTTLLAFNASIEAARAGDSGRGFSVVAEEIKKLAEETQKATEQISVLFDELRDQTEKASNSVNQLLNANDQQTELIDKTGKSFNEIKDNIIIISDKMNEQVGQMERVSSYNSEIYHSVENLSAFSEELLANMENTKHLTDSTVDGTEKISGLLDNVMVDINTLQNMSE